MPPAMVLGSSPAFCLASPFEPCCRLSDASIACAPAVAGAVCAPCIPPVLVAYPLSISHNRRDITSTVLEHRNAPIAEADLHSYHSPRLP
jgi:hypothetical protein